MDATELLVEGLITTVIGMGIVFIILGLLCWVLYLLKFVNRDNDNKENLSAEIIVPKADNASTDKDTNTNVDELELVAAITAAIATSMGTSTDKLIVRSITRVKSWNTVSKREQQRIF